MTIKYAGDAGGQPRLLIPTIDRITDPATKIAMNEILRWANTLLMGGGSLADFAQYEATIVGGTVNPVTWTQVVSSGFAYLDGAGQDVIAFPPKTYTGIFYGFVGTGFIVPSGMDMRQYISLQDGGGSDVGNVAVFTLDVGIIPTDFNMAPNTEIFIDVDHLPSGHALPYHFISRSQDVVNSQGAFLYFLSWSKP